MELELGGWKMKVALVALVAVVVAAPLARAVHANRNRAEDWHRRAVVAEESVGGLRVVIAQRSRALNQRTMQANQLASEVESTRAALQRSKVDVGTLTERQRKLASQNARVESERQKLQTQQSALESIAAKLSACTKGLGGALGPVDGKGSSASAAIARSRLASCKNASASLDAYLEQVD